MKRLWVVVRWILILWGLGCALFVASCVVITGGQGKPAPFPLEPSARKPIVEGETDPAKLPDRKLVSDIFEGAFASRDAKRLAAHYTDDAWMQDSWGTVTGNKELFEYYETQFSYAHWIKLHIHDYVQDGNRVAITLTAEQQTTNLHIKLPAMVYLEFHDRKIRYQREYWDVTAFLDETPILDKIFAAFRNYATMKI